MKGYLVDVFVWGNLAVCLAVAWICICRFTLMQRTTTRTYLRLSYAAMFTSSVTCGVSPWLFGDDIGFGTVMLSSALCANLLNSAPLWKAGVPEFGRSEAMPLDDGCRVERRKLWK